MPNSNVVSEADLVVHIQLNNKLFLFPYGMWPYFWHALITFDLNNQKISNKSRLPLKLETSVFSFNLISVVHNIKGFHVQICHRGTPRGEI